MKFELVTPQMLEGALKSFKDVDVDAKLLNYVTTSELDQLKSELLLAIQQGVGEAVQVYAEIFSLGNSDASDILLNTGKIGLVLKNITQSELNIWEELTTMEDVINSEEAFNEVINSTTAMSAVANSTTAWNTVMNSTAAWNTIMNSTVAMNAVINSTAAWNAVMNSTTAWNAVMNSTTAWNAVMNSTVAMNAVANSTSAWNSVMNNTTAFNTVINSTSAWNSVMNNTTAFNTVINSTSAFNTVINSTSAMNAVINSTSAMNAVANSTTALQTIGDNEVAMMMLIQHKKTLTHSSSNAKSINGLVLSLQSTKYNVYRLVFSDGTNANAEIMKHKLSNGQYNILKQYPKITTMFELFSNQTVYYYPLD